MEATEVLARRLRVAKTAFAFTGAGISTESGIPDFRSPGGVWSRERPVAYGDFLASRAERARYWRMRREAYPGVREARPNAGHLGLAVLEAEGRIGCVVTQNIDGLHQDAGSRRVLELHGTVREVSCVGCDRRFDPALVHEWIEQGNEAPDCPDCGRPLKSRTVSFGQALPPEVVKEAFGIAEASDLCLAIGSSLVVEPAASIPRLTAARGAFLAIVNRDPTPLDEVADLVIREPIGRTMETLLAALGAREPGRAGVRGRPSARAAEPPGAAGS